IRRTSDGAAVWASAGVGCHPTIVARSTAAARARPELPRAWASRRRTRFDMGLSSFDRMPGCYTRRGEPVNAVLLFQQSERLRFEECASPDLRYDGDRQMASTRGALDLDIIRCLQDDARSSVAGIAGRLRVPESTVRHRLNRLVKEGVVEF